MKRHIIASILRNSAQLQSFVSAPDVIVPTTAPKKAVLRRLHLLVDVQKLTVDPQALRAALKRSVMLVSIPSIPAVLVAQVPSGSHDTASQLSILHLARKTLATKVQHQLTFTLVSHPAAPDVSGSSNA